VTRVTFENATIRDVIGKAARIAPTKGSAFDKAAGILMVIDGDLNQITVKATDLDVFYMEIADFTEIEGSNTVWRIPSSIIDGICSKLPISSGKTVSFDDEGGGAQLKITSGRMRANVRIIDPSYYPEWDAFDPKDLDLVADFGARIQMVQWAAARAGDPPLIGIHLDGENVIATDRFRIAMAPCKAAPLYKPVTIPSGIFTPLMKSLGDVRLGISDNMLLVQPDDSIQIKAVIFSADYPNIKAVFRRNEDTSVTFKKASLLEIIDRAMVMAAHNRLPTLKMFIGQEEIAVMMEDVEIGLLGDVIEVSGQCQHDRMTILFTPDNITGALNNSPNDEVTMHYILGEPFKPVRIDGGSGYEALVMPRKKLTGDD
jgi:DNA polymerase III sliding clamp (beta) subunit (PCNA family)